MSHSSKMFISRHSVPVIQDDVYLLFIQVKMGLETSRVSQITITCVGFRKRRQGPLLFMGTLLYLLAMMSTG